MYFVNIFVLNHSKNELQNITLNEATILDGEFNFRCYICRFL